MARFVQYTDPINLKEIQNKANDDLHDLKANYAMFLKIRFILEEWNGKKITKRLVTYVDKNLPEATHINIDRPCSTLNYLKFMSNGQEFRFFLSHNDTFEYNKFDEHNSNYAYCDPTAKKLEKGISKLPELVERYNKLLAEQKKLCEDASNAGFDYSFDIIARERN